MRKLKITILACLALTGVVSAYASRMDEVTLVMVPREDNVVSVGKDLAARYPTLLISYQVGGSGAISLHGWTGTEWLNVTPEAFKDGEFFRNGPTDAILIEKEGRAVPDTLVPSQAWCPSVHKITTAELRPLLHLIGQHYDFKYADWKWFASSYKMSMEDINPEGLNIAWYNKPLGEHLRKRSAADGSSDLQYWSILRQPQETIEPVAPAMTEEITEPTGREPMEESQQIEVLEGEDPLTNSLPDAVVLGAGDAEAELTAEHESGDSDSPEDSTEPVQE